MPERSMHSEDIALVELLDRVVEHGVVLSGDITISVADVELIYLGLRLLIRTPITEPAEAPDQLESHAEAKGTNGAAVRLRNSSP
jgi:gas vesicle structural protein